MWRRLTTPSSPLDDDGASSHLRATSLQTVQVGYGRWLEWLFRTRPDVLAGAPADRASPEHLQQWLESLSDVAPMSRLMFVDGVLRVLSTAVPDLDWSLQYRIRQSLRRSAGRGLPSRKCGRVLSSAVLLQAGLDLAGPHADAASTRLEAFKRRRDGAMVGLPRFVAHAAPSVFRVEPRRVHKGCARANLSGPVG